MASILNRKWNWTLATKQSGTGVEDVNVFAWEYDSTTATISTLTNSEGVVTALMTEAVYSITDTDTVATSDKTPHTLSCCKYGLVPKSLDISFLTDRLDTFFMEDNAYISESDSSVVDGYTGITIDHTNEKITISEDHSVAEMYDYVQLDMLSNPVKAFPGGVLATSNGSDYMLGYDLEVDGASLSGSGKYIDMSNDELILVNDGSTSAKVKDKNGLQVSLEFGITISPSQVGYEWRLYDVDAAGSLAGATEFAGEENATADNQAYIYKHNGDRDIAVQVMTDDYEEYVRYYVLSDNNQSVIVNLDTDNND